MNHAIVIVPAAPMRRKPRHQVEMTNQLLFGDAVKVIKEKGPLWVKVRCLADQYEGWVTNTLLQEVKAEEAKAVPAYLTAELFNAIRINGSVMQLPIGCSLPGFADGKGKIGDKEYSYEGKWVKRSEQVLTEGLVKHQTNAWLNAPYMWGGKTIYGVDCSGFVQINYKMMGIDVSRDAWQQAQEGKTVKKLQDAICGDLAFFDDKEEIVHVGILLGPDRIIHASGKVRIDKIDKKGIINGDTGKRTHDLRVIMRYLS